MSKALPGFSNSKTYYIYLNFINRRLSDASFNLEFENGETVVLNVPGIQQKTYKHQVLSRQAPYLSVSAFVILILTQFHFILPVKKCKIYLISYQNIVCDIILERLSTLIHIYTYAIILIYKFLDKIIDYIELF